MTATGATISTTREGSSGTAEVQNVRALISSGAFRLSLGEQVTSPLGYNATAAQLAAALTEAGAAIASVTGAGTSADPWVVTFDAASGDVPELVPDSADMINGTVAVATTTQGDPVTQGGEVINSAVIQGGAAVNEVITLYNNAMAERGNGSPKFQIVFDDPETAVLDMSAPVDYNASAADIKTAIEALPYVQTVSVTGSGTAYDPWVVTFIDPGAINIQDLGKKDFEGANFEEALSSTSTTTQGSAVASATHHEIQAFENRAVGGAFSITFGGATTLPLAYNASAEDVENALNALSSIGGATPAHSVHVTGGGLADDARTPVPWSIEFMWDEDVAQITVNDFGLQSGPFSRLGSIENLAGGKGNDLLIGTGDDNVFGFGNNWGDDLVVTNGGGDVLDFTNVFITTTDEIGNVYPIAKVKADASLTARFNPLIAARFGSGVTASTLAASESDDLHIFVAITKDGATEVLNRVVVYGSFKFWQQKGSVTKLGAPSSVAPLNQDPAAGLTPDKTVALLSYDAFPYSAAELQAGLASSSLLNNGGPFFAETSDAQRILSGLGASQPGPTALTTA